MDDLSTEEPVPMTYLPHQIETSDKVAAVVKDKGICLLQGEMRTGKTRTAIRTLDLLGAKRPLIVTKKAAIKGWWSEVDAVRFSLGDGTVTNYEQCAKLHADDFDFVVVDESHAISRPGKPTKRWKHLRRISWDKPVLLMTGTPSTESLLQLYYQFALSERSPLRYKNFYEFFRAWGVSSQIRINGRWVEQYKKARPDLLDRLKLYIVTLTQDQAGITHKAVDKVHKVELSAATNGLIATIQRDKVASIAPGVVFAAESDMAERVAIHQIEAGAVMVDEQLIDLPNTEVIDYIKKTWGDSEGLALMAHFRSTRMKLEKHFPKASIFSSVAHAEGVSLADFEHFVIVNSDYSGAKFVQRRDRGVNLNKRTDAVVNHIVTDGGVSEHVYTAVSKKLDFTLKNYRRLRAV
jgi:hypothetical protein